MADRPAAQRGNSPSTQTIALPDGVAADRAALLASSLASNYNQTETNVFFDATAELTLRGGYRYVWGDASDAVLPQAGELTGAGTGEAAAERRARRCRSTGRRRSSADGGSGGRVERGVYFSTSLYDYQKVRAQARYQATKSLSVALDFTYLNNQNPTPGINYTFRSHQESVSIFWSPASGKIFTFQGSYSWSSLQLGHFVSGAADADAGDFELS